MTMHLPIMVNLLTALGLGVLIGIERQWRQRAAGLRTNALVAVGSAAFVALATVVEGENSPTRIAAQVASGIGFLGAGVILREGAGVRGLNTAATLWGAASVGVLAGSGYPLLATTAALLVILSNVLLRPLARRDRPASVQARTNWSCATPCAWCASRRTSCTSARCWCKC
jgi:putative Mg2+ transporter-C (MgtC) family protein